MKIKRWDAVRFRTFPAGEWHDGEVLQVTHVKKWWYYKVRDVFTNKTYWRLQPADVRKAASAHASAAS